MLSEIKKYDCGSLKNPRFPDQKQIKGTKIPLLEEVFLLVKKKTEVLDKKIKLNIEMKIKPAHSDLTPKPKNYAKPS